MGVGGAGAYLIVNSMINTHKTRVAILSNSPKIRYKTATLIIVFIYLFIYYNALGYLLI